MYLNIVIIENLNNNKITTTYLYIISTYLNKLTSLYDPGERFAMVEMKIAMTKLLSKFNIEANEMTKLELRKGDQFLLSYDKMLVRIFARREE